MTRSTNMEHVEVLRRMRNEWPLATDEGPALDAAIASLSAPQPPAEAHCATCACVPGMTPAIRFDATAAEKEGAVREQLIRMGWTPPAEAQAQGGGEASEGWHAALDSASELVSNAPDARYRKRAEQVRDWIKARPAEAQERPAKPAECADGCPDQQVCDHCQWPPGPDAEAQPVAWRATVEGLRKFVTDATFRRFSPEIQRFYEPYKCGCCRAASPSAPVGVEVLARGHFHPDPDGGNDWEWFDGDAGAGCTECVRAVIIPAAALAQQPAAVDSEMVKRAVNAYDEATGEGWQMPCLRGMRAALIAALAAQQGGE